MGYTHSWLTDSIVRDVVSCGGTGTFTCDLVKHDMIILLPTTTVKYISSHNRVSSESNMYIAFTMIEMLSNLSDTNIIVMGMKNLSIGPVDGKGS